jgi:hypothetical protein
MRIDSVLSTVQLDLHAVAVSCRPLDGLDQYPADTTIPVLLADHQCGQAAPRSLFLEEVDDVQSSDLDNLAVEDRDERSIVRILTDLLEALCYPCRRIWVTELGEELGDGRCVLLDGVAHGEVPLQWSVT